MVYNIKTWALIIYAVLNSLLPKLIEATSPIFVAYINRQTLYSLEATKQPQLPPQSLIQLPPQSSIQLPPPPTKDILKKYPEISEYFLKTDDKYQAYYRMEKLARHLAELGLFKESTLYYEWLLKQADLSEKRKEQNLDNLKYVSGRWEFSDDFSNDIAQDNLVTAIITDDRVNFRQNPEIVSDNVIRQLNSGIKLQVLQRSNSRQKIGTGSNYWYKVRATDGTEGWVYGQYIFFYLNAHA